MSVFGFSTEPSSGGDWLPIATYDARAGRFFRIDRLQDSSGNWTTDKVDITTNFKAMADFDNIETGWLNFAPGQTPNLVLVPLKGIADKTIKMPDRPSDLHKNGIRFVVKLSKDIGGDRPIREIASSAKAFLGAIETVYEQYAAERSQHPGMLPVLVCDKTTPVTTGSGKNSSTNYAPSLRIAAWVPRNDLVPQPRGTTQPQQAPQQPQQATQQAAQQQSAPQSASWGNGGTAAPSTGGQRAAPPQPQSVDASDFG